MLESLIDADCFSSFSYNHKTLYNNIDAMINYATLTKDLGEEFVLKPEIERTEEFEKELLIAKEKELFGFYLTNHPVSKYKIEKENNKHLNQMEENFNKRVILIAMVEKIKKIMTKKQEEMAFVTISDEYTQQEMIVFPNLLSTTSLKVGDIIEVTGRVEKRYTTYQIIADKIEILNIK